MEDELSTAGYDYTRLIRNDSSGRSSTICVICCGVLQELDAFETIERVVKYIKAEDFEFNAFKFFVKVPISSVIRMTTMLYMFAREERNRGDVDSDAMKKELAALLDFKQGTIDVSENTYACQGRVD